MTKQEQAEYDQMLEDQTQHEQDLANQWNNIFNHLLERKGKEWVDLILEDMCDGIYNSDGTPNIGEFFAPEIVEDQTIPKNRKKEFRGSDKTKIETYVDQHTVGTEGDSFAGWIYYRLDENSWVKIQYEM